MGLAWMVKGGALVVGFPESYLDLTNSWLQAEERRITTSYRTELADRPAELRPRA